VSLEFLSADAVEPFQGRAPVARSPLERSARAAGARFEVRDGWNVAAGYGPLAEEREACARAVGWADASHRGKLEVQADAATLAAIAARWVGGAAGVGAAGSGDVAGSAPPLGTAARAGDGWWCPLTGGRALAVCPPDETSALRARLEAEAEAAVVDLTTAYAALVIAGPLARETIARFCALDLRPHVTPVGGLRPGSVARTPGMVLREAEDRYLLLVGAALADYLWTVVDDAGRHLGGRPVGEEATHA
jgi:heterotetrameric sarcosine oxidase gamma subunit